MTLKVTSGDPVVTPDVDRWPMRKYSDPQGYNIEKRNKVTPRVVRWIYSTPRLSQVAEADI